MRHAATAAPASNRTSNPTEMVVDSVHHLGRIGDRGGPPITSASGGFDLTTMGHRPFQWDDPNQFLPALPGERLDLLEFEDATDTGSHFGSGGQLFHLD